MSASRAVTRLIELYALRARDPQTASYQAEQMRLLTTLSPTEQTAYYRAIRQPVPAAPTAEIIEWP